MNVLYFQVYVCFKIKPVVKIKHIASNFMVSLLIFKQSEQWVLFSLGGLHKRVLSIFNNYIYELLSVSEWQEFFSICLKT